MTQSTEESMVARDAWRRSQPLPQVPGRRPPWRRIILFPLLFAALAGLGWLFFRPFLDPRTHLVVISAGEFGVLTVPPVPYADLEADRFQDLGDAVTVHAGERFDRLLDSPSDLKSLSTRLRALGIHPRDSLIVYVSAHGVAHNQTPFLMCNNFDPDDPIDGLSRLNGLLEDLRDFSAATKLLVLNTGAMDDDVQQDLLVSEFPWLAETALDEVREVGDRVQGDLWLLTAHSQSERAHVSRALRGTVFSAFFAKGLSGAADIENPDGAVDIRELQQFVGAHVSNWVSQTSGQSFNQSPLLLPQDPENIDKRLVTLEGPAAGPQQVNIEQMIQLAREKVQPRRAIPVVATQRGLVNRVAPAAANTSAGTDPAAAGASVGISETGESPSGDESVEGAEEAPDGEADTPPSLEEQLQRLVDRAWKLRDQFGTRPERVAPHLWRELNQEILDAQRRWRIGTRGDAELALQMLTRTTGALELTGQQATGGNLRSILLDADGNEFDLPLPNSLALAIQLTKDESLSNELKVLADQLDLLVAEMPSDLATWLSENRKPGSEKYYEWQLVEQLAAVPNLNQEIMRQAIRTRRDGERTAAASIGFVGFVDRAIEEADQLRLAAERQLIDQIDQDWEAKANGLFLQSAAGYRKAVSAIDSLRESSTLRDELLFRSPLYVRHFGAVPEAFSRSKIQTLHALLEDLENLVNKLERPAPTNVDDIRTLSRSLTRGRDVIETVFGTDDVLRLTSRLRSPQAGDGLKLERLLDSVLLNHNSRSALVRAADPIADNLARSLALPDPVDIKNWRPATRSTARSTAMLDRCVFEYRLARIAAGQTYDESQDSAVRELSSALQAIEIAETDQSRSVAYGQFSALMRRFCRELDRRIELPSGEQTPREATSRLLAARRALPLLTFRDVWRLDQRLPELSYQRLSRRVDLFHQLAWQNRRAGSASRDVSPDRAKLLEAAADSYRTTANRLLAGPPSDPLSPGLEMKIQSRLSLVNQDEQHFNITLFNPTDVSTRAWLVVHHQHSMIEVVGDGDFAKTVYTQQRLDDSSGDTTPDMIGSDQLPVGTDPRGLPPTVEIASGQRAEVPLKIRLREPVSISTPLDFKLIAQRAAPNLANPAGEQDEAVVSPSDRWNRESPVAYKRQRIRVALPSVRLSVDGADGTLTSGPRDSILHTYPNNVTRFRFGVVNNTSELRNITMRVLPAPHIAEWNELLRSPSDLAAWSASTPELSDAAGNSLAWTIAAAVGTDASFPSEGEADGEGEEKGVKEGGDAKPEEEQEGAPEIPPGPPLERDLVVELRDAEAPNDAVYNRIRVTSQRPRRYVTATVGYSIPKQRIDIEVARRGRVAPQLPPVSIRCEVASGMDRPPQGKLEATLQPPDHRARLFVEVPAAPQRLVKLLLHVDGYPRAFVYSVRCGEHSTNSPESRNLVAVRIVNLDESIAPSDKTPLVVAPKPTAPVEVQIDAPVGSFENQRDTVTLGVDGDGDDVLESDTVITLRNDRDAQVRIAEAGAGGELSLDTRVTDWRLQMPTRGLRNVVASIRGRMQVGSRSHDISPNLVGFDDAPPVIEYVGLRPRRRNIVAGTDIGIAVSARDKLSRVESVAMAFAAPGADSLPEDAELIEAKPIDENRIQWVATANVGEEAGSRTLLVQATDSAGQQGLAKLDLQVLSQEQYEATLRVTIRGVVTYRSERVPETNIEFIPEQGKPLKATSDASGTFVIRNAPMGAYQLKARGILRNIPRFAEQTVTVDATKQTKMQLDLDLQ